MTPDDWTAFKVFTSLGAGGLLSFALWSLFREWWLPMSWHLKRAADQERALARADARIAQLEQENTKLRELLYQLVGLTERTVAHAVDERRAERASASPS